MSGELDAVVKPGLRAAAVLAAWVVVISAAPSLADVLDRHGLPGTAIALVMVFGLAASSVVMVARSLPRTHRIRVLWSAARSAGFGWRSRLRAPSSMFRLPTFRRGSMTVQLFNLVVVESRSNARLVFDVAELPDPGYGDTKWRTSAATHVPYDFPALVVEPRRLVSVDVADGMTVVSTDLGSVDDRWRVRTDDRAFAMAFLDQRMLAWIDALDDDRRLEAGGPWLMVSAKGLIDPDGWDPLLATLDAFRNRVPRVVSSLYT